ncbi:HAD-IIIA family hydrolase [Roseomonas hellenica]|uniref:D,D-heptose 1,7-bisphosphate phosphatase n=1 Tax=Plastoroseomonas hellenica TaxID=2687306 RepID=A0ABS5F4A8_9PROT|nr:HAD-IIIA family hydrolase [Plastoroseomonas hellenica]
MIKQAIFLVGGAGTRLGSITRSTPKPLLELAPGTAFLDLLIDEAARHGFTDILLLSGYLGGQVEQRYHGRRVRDSRLRVLREEEPAGTAGALRRVSAELDPWFLLANGDSFFDINLRRLASVPRGSALGCLALRHVQDTSRFGGVTLEGDRIVDFSEKRGERGPGLINGGLYCLSREIQDRLPAIGSLEGQVFPSLAREGLLLGIEQSGYFIDIGLPESLDQARRCLPQLMTRPAAFLDRDGILNVDHGYTHRPEDLTWIPEAREAVRDLNDAGYFVFVVTNQAGIAHGFYTEAAMDDFHAEMARQLADVGAHVDAFYHCPYHPEASVARLKTPAHADRKPNPGMILRALRDWPVRPAGSFLIGDRDTDIEAASRAGLPGYLYRGGSLRMTVNQAWAACAGPRPKLGGELTCAS